MTATFATLGTPCHLDDTRIHCTLCRRRIGRNRLHLLPANNAYVICGRCADRPDAHERLHPDCPARWHDGHDHITRLATRAAATHLLKEPR